PAAADDRGITVPVLEKAGVPVDQLRNMTESELRRLPKVSGGSTNPGRTFMEVLERSQKEAESMKDQYISTEHLLLALTEVKSEARELLTVNAARRNDILAALKSIRGSASVTSQDPEATYEPLKKYGRDLVDMARQGKLDPVIGRDD